MGDRDLLPTMQTFTTEATHDLVRSFAWAAQVLTKGEGHGPRYCPSLDRKVVRFPSRDRHQVWLENESLDRDGIVYPNGISMSLHPDVQRDIVRTIPGLGGAVLTRPGYSVEYEHVDPRVLRPTLEVGGAAGTCGPVRVFIWPVRSTERRGTRRLSAGLVAGANAASRLSPHRRSFWIARSVHRCPIDDLISNGVTEPYRMFSSRSEYRLTLRAENADLRLTDVAVKAGILPADSPRGARPRKKEACEEGRKVLGVFG